MDDNFDDISNIETYSQYLDKYVTKEDLMYLEDEELARKVKELYEVQKGEIRNKDDFDRKKKELDEKNNEIEEKEQIQFSQNMHYIKGSFLDLLKERESDVRNGTKSTIIFIRYKDKKGKETSAYIDYRDRLKNEEMEAVFKGGLPLIPKPNDLSYFNWNIQKVNSLDSTFFRVDAGPKERLSFKNNSDRKIINVDLEYIENHPGLYVKRIPVVIKNENDDIINQVKYDDNSKLKVTHIDVEKENVILKNLNKKKFNLEKNENEDWGYQQIVIFDYEIKNR